LSSISRRDIRATARKLAALQERRLDRYDVVALVLDGKRFAEDTMVVALGITLRGEKVLLGFVQTGTENTTACAAFLRRLLERGLQVAAGVLVVLDGGKGLRRAVREVFGEPAHVQRCVWHKRENVVAHLLKHLQAAWRATILLELEPRLRRLRGCRALPQLRAALTHDSTKANEALVA
jgi:transposase-like protein